MSKIILIETSTSLCSVALAEDGKITASRESEQPRAHAAMTAPYVQQVLQERGLTVKDCDAVCLSMGPGSYTGLRVGSSTAKGLCFGAGIPLFAVSTPEVLVWQAIEDGLIPEGCTRVAAMIDARRMEVYTAMYEVAGGQVKALDEVRPLVVDQDSFAATLAEQKVLFIGDGALKCKDVLNSGNAHFAQCCPRASAMLKPALREMEAGAVRDTAYFEPFYLKDFVATVSRKNLF